MQRLDVFKKESGKLSLRKATPASGGLVLSITHSAITALPLQSQQNVRFLSTAFDRSGNSFLAADHQGNVFHFDLINNRFKLILRTGQVPGCLAYSLSRSNEFLIANADYSLSCYDTESRQLVSCMRGHQSLISHVSIDSTGLYAISCSLDTAQLWDLDTFQRKRRLNVKQGIGIVKVMFIPGTTHLLTCFKDDSIFAWDSETLECMYELHTKASDTLLPSCQRKTPSFKTFAISGDGQLLVGAGRSRFVYVWLLSSRSLLRVIELSLSVTCVNQLDLLPDLFSGASQTLLVLTQDGLIQGLNLQTYEQVFKLGAGDSNHRAMSMSVSTTGRHLVCITDHGDVNLYDTSVVSGARHNKPPAPLVKLQKSYRMSDHTPNFTGSLSARSQLNRSRSLRSTLEDSEELLQELPEKISTARLLAILKEFGEYPAKYRMFIWRTLLRLPDNTQAYAALVDKGTHSAFTLLHQCYPVKSRKLLRILQRVLSLLAHWSPIFGETDYLPMLVFPFVKLFQSNQLVCFEVVATIMVNWCGHWFEYFPNPPINILSLAENLLAHRDQPLLQHFIKHNITSQIYAWPVLETFFSEVLTRDEWLRLIDHVFTNQPSFLLAASVAYCTVGRSALLSSTEREDFVYYFHHRNALSVNQLINESYSILQATPSDLHPSNVLEDFKPLTRGAYPIFNKYPKFIVDFQVQERERIRKEEVELARQTMLTSELRGEIERKRDEEREWYNQQEVLAEAERERQRVIEREEHRLTEQRTRLMAMKREMRMKELELLDAARRRFMTFSKQQKEAELMRLDDEIRKKVNARTTETQTAIDEVTIRNMELHIQRKLLEQELWRQDVDLTNRRRNETDAWRDQQGMERDMRWVRQQEKYTDRERQEIGLREDLVRGVGQADLLLADVQQRSRANDVLMRQRLNQSEEERTTALLEELREQNRELEVEVIRTLKRLEATKVSAVRDTESGQGARSVEELGQRSSVLEGHAPRSFSTASLHSASRDLLTGDDTYSIEAGGRESLDNRERLLLSDVNNVRHRIAVQQQQHV